METLAILLVAAVVFGVCYLVDKGFAKLFRSRAQHMSGMAVRVAKRFGIFGVIFIVLGVMAIVGGISGETVLLGGGIIVLITGICLAVYYLSYGIFYDGESFLQSRFGRKSVTYRYKDIREQKLYLIQGGSILVELHMTDGNAISLQSNMEGIYPFLDTAFTGWCLQTGRDPQSCDFHDPANHWWFPHEEDV